MYSLSCVCVYHNCFSLVSQTFTSPASIASLYKWHGEGWSGRFRSVFVRVKCADPAMIVHAHSTHAITNKLSDKVRQILLGFSWTAWLCQETTCTHCMSHLSSIQRRGVNLQGSPNACFLWTAFVRKLQYVCTCMCI